MTAEDDGLVYAPLVASVGMHVELELIEETGDVERLGLDIVHDSAADFGQGLLGAGTALAQAIMGKPAGAEVHYGRAGIATVHLLAVALSERRAEPGAAERRQAITDEAVARSQLEDAVRLALTVDVKWGDYDPEALEQERPDAEE